MPEISIYKKLQELAAPDDDTATAIFGFPGLCRIEDSLKSLTPAQLAGLGVACFYSIREQMNLDEAVEELGFTDISEKPIVEEFAYATDERLASLAQALASFLGGRQ